MEVGLFRKLNAIGMLAVCAVLAMAFYILGTAIIAAYSTQYHKQKFIPFGAQSGVAKVAIVVSVVFVAMNAVVTFAECGPLQCPDNPTSYWLLN
jgi:hypothetical protein